MSHQIGLGRTDLALSNIQPSQVRLQKDPLMVLADKISAPTGQDHVQQLEAHVGGADDEQLASLTVFQLRSFLLTCFVVQSL